MSGRSIFAGRAGPGPISFFSARGASLAPVFDFAGQFRRMALEHSCVCRSFGKPNSTFPENALMVLTENAASAIEAFAKKTRPNLIQSGSRFSDRKCAQTRLRIPTASENPPIAAIPAPAIPF
jgi:hypothetical protein